MEHEEFALSNPACVSIPVTDADRLLSCGDPNCAMLYLYLLRSGRAMNPQRASEDLGLSVKAVQDAGNRLKQMGLLNAGPARPAAPADELPEYDSGYIVTRSQQDPAFRDLLSEARNILGHSLSTADTKILFGIYDHLGLPPEVLLMLMTSCAEEYREKYGPGRTPTMRAIEKEAFVWARLEVFTLEQAEHLLESRRAKKDAVLTLKRELGIRDRELSPTEKRYLSDWLELGFGTEAILMAYDRTVTQTGALKWPYMNKIIQSWHSKGLHTPEEIREKDTLPSRKQPAAQPPRTDRRPGGEKENLMKFYEKMKK